MAIVWQLLVVKLISTLLAVLFKDIAIVVVKFSGCVDDHDDGGGGGVMGVVMRVGGDGGGDEGGW